MVRSLHDMGYPRGTPKTRTLSRFVIVSSACSMKVDTVPNPTVDVSRAAEIIKLCKLQEICRSFATKHAVNRYHGNSAVIQRKSTSPCVHSQDPWSVEFVDVRNPRAHDFSEFLDLVLGSSSKPPEALQLPGTRCNTETRKSALELTCCRWN